MAIRIPHEPEIDFSTFPETDGKPCDVAEAARQAAEVAEQAAEARAEEEARARARLEAERAADRAEIKRLRALLRDRREPDSGDGR